MNEVLFIRKGGGIQEPCCIWGVPDNTSPFIEIGDEWWSASFGSTQMALTNITDECLLELDFARVEWIDPLALLSLLLLLKGFCVRTNSSLQIQLGSSEESNSRRHGFLQFLWQHGFIDSLHGLHESRVSLDGHDYPIRQNSSIWEKNAPDLHVLTYPDSRCLNAKLIDVRNLRGVGDSGVADTVRFWLDEIRDHGLKRYEHDAEYVDDMLHKIRIILTENLLNVVEHAHYQQHPAVPQYFAVYARIRREAVPGEEFRLTDAIRREDLRCPGLVNFLRDCDCSWIEVFCCDDGRGLLADIGAWQTNAGEGLRKKLGKIKATTNVLHQISRCIFQDAISRHDRKEKTVLTGLQHTGLVLADGHDYARVYSQGEWVGATHPWAKNVHGVAINLRKQTKYIHDIPSRGTAWHYCIRLSTPQEQLSGAWPGERVHASDFESSPSQRARPEVADWKIFDERDLGSGVSYCHWSAEMFSASHSLWLPGAVTKQHVYQWLTAIINAGQTGPIVWLIADLSREQARTLRAVLESERSRKQLFPQMDIFIVTTDWHINCLKTTPSRTGFKETSKSYCRRVAKERGRSIFTLLRNHDSTLFWSGVLESSDDANAVGSPFIAEPVIWDRDDEGNPRVVLRGYLDLTHALVDARRTSVAARSLRRVWHLFARDAECVASDALLTNLLPREARQSLVGTLDVAASDSAKRVIVNSVLVTGNTASRHAYEGREAVHLLRHSQFLLGHEHIPDSVSHSDRFALSWIDHLVDVADTPPESLPYERIPGTPYVGRGGPKAIPVRRFERKNDEVGYFEKSIYEQNPQDTYDHFMHLGLLKFGHWVYGAHHDLMTLNLGLAIDRESLDHGPILEWLCAELARQKALGAYLVVYPSHPVTEKLVQAIKRNSSCASGYDCQDNFIPVHFLGSHTQTSIRIPSLTYDRIRSFLEGTEIRRVVLLDDGALTGKVQRELEQLIRNAGAKSVVHIGIVTRTGLPLYRQYLVSEYKDAHRFYWRWDVPPLGSARTCPLCKAIQQAREIAGTLWSNKARVEVGEWVNTWLEQPVATHWWSSGLVPARLPATRPLTFGKEWIKSDATVAKYSITHATTTGLASSIVELIRATSYKDVGVKLAQNPWPKDWRGDEVAWRRARLEILTSQTLLFFDDFDHDELVTRFELILEVLGSSSDDSDGLVLDSLACLTLMLSTDKQARDVVLRTASRLPMLTKAREGFHVSLGLLIRRGNLGDEQILRAAERSHKLDKHKTLLLRSLLITVRTSALGREVRGTAHGLQMLTMLLGESSSSMHTGFLSKRLSGEIEGGRSGIVRDLQTVIQAFEEIDPLICDAQLSKWNRNWFIEQTDRLIQVASLGDNTSLSDICEPERNRLNEGIAILSDAFREAFLESATDIASSLGSAVTHALFFEMLKLRDVATRDRWGFMADENSQPMFRLPAVVTSLDESPLNKSRIVVYPPVGRQMVLDSLLDVIHSSGAFSNGSDMRCHLSIADGKLTIEMCNLATSGDRIATIKASEAIYAQHISRAAIRRRFNAEQNEMIVEIDLSLVTSLGEAQT